MEKEDPNNVTRLGNALNERKRKARARPYTQRGT
jgi:hypothetical protein